MKTQNNTTENSGIIVAFHIGRGGQFYNSGHKTFIGERKIDEFTNDLFLNYENTFEISQKLEGYDNLTELFQTAIEDSNAAISAKARLQKWGFDLGEQIYTGGNGESVGLSVAKAETGIGRINIDYDYDTTYTCYVENCDEHELQLIKNCSDYKSPELEDFLSQCLSED